jgi:hypothetical protein
MNDFILYLHFIASFIMLGVILVIQLVHYPSFLYVDETKFLDFEYFHSKTISYIVFPVMLLELLTCLYLFYNNFFDLIYFLILSITILIWISTLTLSMPCHVKLSKKFDAKIIKRLIKTNWPRTILWSIKSGVLLWIIISKLPI